MMLSMPNYFLPFFFFLASLESVEEAKCLSATTGTGSKDAFVGECSGLLAVGE